MAAEERLQPLKPDKSMRAAAAASIAKHVIIMIIPVIANRHGATCIGGVYSTTESAFVISGKCKKCKKYLSNEGDNRCYSCWDRGGVLFTVTPTADAAAAASTAALLLKPHKTITTTIG